MWKSVSINRFVDCGDFLYENGLPHQCAHWFAMTVKKERVQKHPGRMTGVKF